MTSSGGQKRGQGQFFEIFVLVIFLPKFLKNFVEIGPAVQKLVFLRPPQWPNQNFPGVTHPAKLKPYPQTKLVPSFIKIVRAVFAALKKLLILAKKSDPSPRQNPLHTQHKRKIERNLSFTIISFTTFKKRLETQSSFNLSFVLCVKWILPRGRIRLFVLNR